jgi:hypothetical protein
MDVWSGGVAGLIAHYNGGSWRTFAEVNLGFTYIEYHAVAVKGNTVVLGGYTHGPDHAIVTIGKRIN